MEIGRLDRQVRRLAEHPDACGAATAEVSFLVVDTTDLICVKESAAVNATTPDEVLGYFEQLSNWGRWGTEDERGAINLITAGKVREAAQLIREGVAVSCGRSMDRADRSHVDTPGFAPLVHYMSHSGDEWRDVPQQPHMFQVAADYVAFTIHGYQYTHLDSLSHVFWNGMGYNGRPAAAVSTRDLAQFGGVQNFRTGITSRGVLLDFTKLRDTSGSDAREIITIGDLEEMEERSGVVVSSGDILLHRTGVVHPGGVGFHPNVLPWLHERGVAVFGGDTAQDPGEPIYPDIPHPIHQVGIVAMGMLMLDNMMVDDLAATCDRLSRWEFSMSILPLPIVGATGSPVNPVAVF